MAQLDEAVAAHYGRDGISARVLGALRDAGLDLDNLTHTDLAPVDEFHVGGRAATQYIIGKLGLPPGATVLDIGCGIGGVARYLAAECRTRVSGIDLTPEYIDLARDLTARTGLATAIDFVVGSALDLPWPTAHFDAAVTFHVAMNIADRPRLYAEAARVLKPRALLAVYDIMKGGADGVAYPLPWSETGEMSFLCTPAETRRLVEAAGFEIVSEEERRSVALEHHRARIAKLSGRQDKPLLGPHLLQGETAGIKSRNMVAGLEADQITVGLLIARRRSMPT